MRRGPQALTPPPWGADVSISYERFVQPVLDKYCGKCHQGDGKARKKLDLTFRDSSLRDPVYPKLPPQFKEPYITLVGGGNNWYAPVEKKLVNEHGLPASISGCLIVVVARRPVISARIVHDSSRRPRSCPAAGVGRSSAAVMPRHRAQWCANVFMARPFPRVVWCPSLIL